VKKGRRSWKPSVGNAVLREGRSHPWEEPDPPSPSAPFSSASTSPSCRILPSRQRAAPPIFTDACTLIRGHSGEERSLLSSVKPSHRARGWNDTPETPPRRLAVALCEARPSCCAGMLFCRCRNRQHRARSSLAVHPFSLFVNRSPRRRRCSDLRRWSWRRHAHARTTRPVRVPVHPSTCTPAFARCKAAFFFPVPCRTSRARRRSARREPRRRHRGRLSTLGVQAPGHCRVRMPVHAVAEWSSAGRGHPNRTDGLPSSRRGAPCTRARPPPFVSRLCSRARTRTREHHD
jgi:hypothetical protein